MKYFDENDIDHIDSNLWLGNFNGSHNFNYLLKNNIKIIINFYKFPLKQYPNIKYYHIPFKFDKISFDTSIKLIKILKKIFDENNCNILICCKSGHLRSANIVVFYLLNKYKLDFETAFKHVKSIRKYSLGRESNLTRAIHFYKKFN